MTLARRFFAAALAGLLWSGPLFAGTTMPLVPVDVLVLGSGSAYEPTLKKAKEIAKKTGTDFSDLDKVYNPKGRTFVYPAEAGDPESPYMGRAVGACEPECVSVEKSEAFTGMTPGLFIVVGGVFETTAGGKARSQEHLLRFKTHVPDAYLKRSTWDPNCPL